ncbi:MAG: excinuclease ABC subunit UvrC [Halanaerobiales bacterium]
MKHIEEQLKQLPDRPGVYLMKNEIDEIIYVGKAKSLRKRVRSYFRKGNHTYKTKILVTHIKDFDYIVTDTEVEAYILEANLINKYQPIYNIRLKDDKSYPYIKVTLNEDFPRVFKTRLVKNDGARYYGPFTNVDALNKTIDVLKDIYSLRTCRKDLRADKPEERPCLNYHIGKCLGPCIGAISKEDYRVLVDQACLFLSGHQYELIKRIEKEMYQAAEEQNFEKAARLRDSIQALERLSVQQKVMYGKNINQDVIAVAVGVDGPENVNDKQKNSEQQNIKSAQMSGEVQSCVQMLIIRNGRLIGQEYFIMEGTEEESEKEIIESFLPQYYERTQQIPDEVLLSVEVEQLNLLLDLLKEKKGKKVTVTIPQIGEKKRLIEMAYSNARENLKKEAIKEKYKKSRTTDAVTKLGEHLELDHPPDYIEGFDISNIQGTDPVASMVVFKDGRSSKQDYRRFKIKTVEGPNDFASMQEVVGRRYSRLLEEKKPLPSLILIDGGKGQLNSAYEVLEELDISHIPIIGLAKREEEVFLPDRDEPIIIPKNSTALHLIQRVRDEAHRFAVTYHRKLRSRRLTHTMLDDIPGVGPKRRQALLQHFGSLAEIRKANITRLKEVEGISSKTARIIYDFLRENTRAY